MFVVGVREYTCVLLNFFILNGSLFFHHTVELGDFCPEVNSNLFYCLDHYIIVFSLHRARWFDRTTVFSVQCYSRCGSLSFLNFGLKTAYFTLMSAYNRIECFLRICFISLLKSSSALILALALYCRVSGQVPFSARVPF